MSKKRKYQRHPAITDKEVVALKRLSRTDQRAIRGGILAATRGLNLEENLGFAIANTLTIRQPAYARDLIAGARIAGNNLLNDAGYSQVLFEDFGGDMARMNRAVKEAEKADWILDADLTAENCAEFEETVKHLSAGEKSILIFYAEHLPYRTPAEIARVNYMQDVVVEERATDGTN